MVFAIFFKEGEKDDACSSFNISKLSIVFPCATSKTPMLSVILSISSCCLLISISSLFCSLFSEKIGRILLLSAWLSSFFGSLNIFRLFSKRFKFSQRFDAHLDIVSMLLRKDFFLILIHEFGQIH